MSEIRCRTIDCQDLRVKTINGRPYLSQPVAIMVPNPTVSRAAAERDGDDQTVSPKTEAPPAESSGD